MAANELKKPYKKVSGKEVSSFFDCVLCQFWPEISSVLTSTYLFYPLFGPVCSLSTGFPQEWRTWTGSRSGFRFRTAWGILASKLFDFVVRMVVFMKYLYRIV